MKTISLALVLAWTSSLGLSALLTGATPAAAAGTRFSWQESYARVDPKGDLAWQPRPFVFEKADPVRYIDFEGGDDQNPGDTPQQPWKHHPWDPQATGRAAAAKGVRTFVFKRGSVYRGRLMIKEYGQPGARWTTGWWNG